MTFILKLYSITIKNRNENIIIEKSAVFSALSNIIIKLKNVRTRE